MFLSPIFLANSTLVDQVNHMQVIFINCSSSKSDESDVEAFEACMKNALVVSEVFCLPSDYRKDVPPPSKFSIHILFKSKLMKEHG